MISLRSLILVVWGVAVGGLFTLAYHHQGDWMMFYVVAGVPLYALALAFAFSGLEALRWKIRRRRWAAEEEQE